MKLADRAVGAASGWLQSRTSRRGFLARSAVVGSALSVGGWGFLVKPQTAYASVCGPGASCSSGWAVFCATINKGVNACPPGSIAAGWWKADGASLCGGRARYIIDCNAACTRCAPSGRPGLCPSSCWNCSCGCGPAGQCDNRRVCCNNFRYGQCNQQIPQVGAVKCRVVSCIPPWTFERCTKSPATDNRTRDHNSPALPSAWTAITGLYLHLGERLSKLGPTVGGEFATAGGRAQKYKGGRISNGPKIGPRTTYGAITTRYVALGAEAGILGFPTTHHSVRGAGAANDFQRGRVSWSAQTGAWETLGEVAVRYRALQSELGSLGFPTGPSVIPKDGKGRVSPFQLGRISWHPDTGARVLGVELVPRYLLLGAEGGSLGYPTADQDSPVEGIMRATFQKGRLSWSSTTGAIETLDVIADAYVRSGAETGTLGLPTELETKTLLGRAQRFQTGRVSALGDKAYFLRGPIAAKYEEMGAESSSLGYPTSDEYVLQPGQRRNDFQLGYITYDEQSDQAYASITG
jgi:uncharacterized protein with LGFP repeats